jgi:hypothetical protein
MSLRAYFLPANKAVARWQKNDPPLNISLQDRRAMVLAKLKNLGRARTEKSFTKAYDRLMHSCHAVRSTETGYGPLDFTALLLDHKITCLPAVLAVIVRLAQRAFHEHKHRWLGRLDVFVQRWPTADELQSWIELDSSSSLTSNSIVD